MEKLRTLGEFHIDGAANRPVKPLLVLTFLALNGRSTRAAVIDQVFNDPEKSPKDLSDSLSSALQQLKKVAPELFTKDGDDYLEANVQCDAAELIKIFEATDAERDLARVVELYKGPFLKSIENRIPAPMWDWVEEQRFLLALYAFEALLALAETRFEANSLKQAERYALQAFQMLKAGDVSPAVKTNSELENQRTITTADEDRLQNLLRALDSDHARDEGVFIRTVDDVSSQRGSAVIGHQFAQRTLQNLPPAAWVWIQGPPGYGKSLLLNGIDGLPLDIDLLAQPRTLLQQKKPLLIDDWSKRSPEVQAQIKELHRQAKEQHSLLRVVITDRGEPALRVQEHIELEPLTGSDLSAYPNVFSDTGGHPALASAHLTQTGSEMEKQEQVKHKLRAFLSELNERDRRLLFAVTLPSDQAMIKHLPLIRAALEISPLDMEEALEALLGSGLVSRRNTTVIPRQALLAAIPREERQKIALKLARVYPLEEAWPFYEQGQTYWETHDEERAAHSALIAARHLFKQAHLHEALEVLEFAPQHHVDLLCLKAEILERTGQYRQSKTILANLPPSEARDCTLAAVHWRLGEANEARELAQSLAGSRDLNTRLLALQLLGTIALNERALDEAQRYWQKAEGLALIAGDEDTRFDLWCDLAVVQAVKGTNPMKAFEKVQQAAGKNPALQARALVNLGKAHEMNNELDEALSAYNSAIEILEDDTGEKSLSNADLARAYLNIGVIYHLQGKATHAERAYIKAKNIAQHSGEQVLIGNVLANYAELTDNQDALEDAISLLENAGQQAEAHGFREILLRMRGEIT